MYGAFLTGMSVCYGGYALSGEDLPELKRQFREALAEDPDLNFLAEFRKGRGASVNRHFSHFVMSAFLCEMALEQGGFEAARRLLYSGPDGERFFSNLERVLGIDEASFHRAIAQRIAAG